MAPGGSMASSPSNKLSPAAVVGAGRVGLALATFLDGIGVEVIIGARSERGRDRVEASGLPVASPVDAARGAALVVLAVLDDELPSLVTALAAEGVFSADQVVVHTAGGDGPALLAPAAAAGAKVVAAFGGRAMDVPESGRVRYHAALVLAANGCAGLAATAADQLRAGGVIDPAALLGGLVHASVDAALATGQAGMSGPWVRGEARTVAMHAEALARKHKIVNVYAALARLVVDRAAAAGRLDPEARRRVEAGLQGHVEGQTEDSHEGLELFRRLGRRARGRNQR